MSRVRAELAVDPEVYRRGRSRLVDVEDLEDLQDALETYGPEPVGFVIELNERGLQDLPDEWRVERLVNVDGPWRPAHTSLEVPEGDDG